MIGQFCRRVVRISNSHYSYSHALYRVVGLEVVALSISSNAFNGIAAEFPSASGQITDVIFALDKRRELTRVVTDDDVDSASRRLLQAVCITPCGNADRVNALAMLLPGTCEPEC